MDDDEPTWMKVMAIIGAAGYLMVLAIVAAWAMTWLIVNWPA